MRTPAGAGGPAFQPTEALDKPEPLDTSPSNWLCLRKHRRVYPHPHPHAPLLPHFVPLNPPQVMHSPMERLETCLLVCKTLFSGRRYKEALLMLDQALARHSTNVELLHLRGLCLQANNNSPAAFATFMSVLNIDPKHVPSLCAVGAMYKARGMLQEAMAAYQKALEVVGPTSTEVVHSLASVLTDMGSRGKAAGSVSDALSYYQRALELCPTYAPTHYHMGVLYSESKQLDAALGWYQQAITLCPSYAEAHCNIGVIYKERGDLEAAIASYERALETAPNFAIVKSNMAIALTDLGTRVKLAGQLTEGIVLYERALSCNPRYADALYNLGVAHGECGQVERAIFMYETAVQCNPACAEAYNNLGVIYKERDNLERAMECYTAALGVKPNFPQSLNNMGVILTCQGRAQEALTLLTAAIAACPTYSEAYNNLGVLQRDVGAIPQALASYSRCLELAPDSRNAGQNRLLALNYIHDGDAEEVCQAHVDWGLRFASLFQPLKPLGPADRDWSLNRPLRVGYISPDLFTHSVSYFAEAPLAFHNTPFRQEAAANVATAAAAVAAGTTTSSAPSTSSPSRPQQPQQQTTTAALALAGSTELQEPKPVAQAGSTSPPTGNGAIRSTSKGTSDSGTDTSRHTSPVADATSSMNVVVQHYVYCCAPKRDAKTARLQSSVVAAQGVWREVTQLSEPDLARLVRQDEIDILVELTGHTANNRLGTMAMRPAPVQVTWIGYPNSTGLQHVDYRITDEYADTWDTKQTFTEELVRLPGGTFLCYTPAHDAPMVAPTPALTSGFVTFGSFNNLAKITPDVLSVWAAILKAVPGSRLVLKNKPFACDTARTHVLNLLAAEGIESWRVDLLPLAAGNSDHLSTYALMDISLDTFPYAGTTTTCESLYMGVPCLTLAGKGHAHNVGVSLLTSVGLHKDWVARSKSEYVSLAMAHALDIPRLAALREGLRQRMMSSRLCDAPVFVAGLEREYHKMWSRHVARMTAVGEDAGADSKPPEVVDTPTTKEGVAEEGAVADEGVSALASSNGTEADVTASVRLLTGGCGGLEGDGGEEVASVVAVVPEDVVQEVRPTDTLVLAAGAQDGLLLKDLAGRRGEVAMVRGMSRGRSSVSRPSSPHTPGLPEDVLAMASGRSSPQ